MNCVVIVTINKDTFFINDKELSNVNSKPIFQTKVNK